MKILNRLSWVAVVLNCIAWALFSERQTDDKQLISLAILLFSMFLMLVNFAAGLRFYMRDKFRAFVPFAICLVGLPIGLIAADQLGGKIQDLRFQKNLPRYMAVVRLIQNGEIPFRPPVSVIELPNQYADLAIKARVETNGAGLTIAFLTGTGFPLKHSGLLYSSGGNVESNADILRRWPNLSRINTNWFRVSD